MARVVIVGAGHGGVQAAVSLRGQGYEGEVVLLGDEDALPYQRPPLSKAYLKDGDADALRMRPRKWFDDHSVDLRTNTRVARIDREGKRVEIEGGEALSYDHLILATGASNVRPPIDGLDREGVYDLRGLSDAKAIRAAMEGASRAVVIGGGFIGLEFAASARAAGLETTVVEMADRLMARVVSPPVSHRFLDAHREMGVDVRLNAAAEALEGGDRVEGVRLKGGEVIPADLVLVATGVRPNIDLAEAVGLEVDDGVVVDGCLRTSDPDISALGDVAAFPGPHGRHVRLESVQAATDHARHIAKRLVEGECGDYDAVPWFWSDQGDLRLQIAGLSVAADDHEVLPHEGPAEAVVSFADGRLVSVETINRPVDHMAARKLLARPERPSREALAAAEWNLKAAAKAQ